MKQLQIAVIGSASSLRAFQIQTAKEVGKEIARSHSILLFSQEGDTDSLPQIAARECIRHHGTIVAISWIGNKTKLDSGIIIQTGQNRGGGREGVLIQSSDAVISIGGGSGTLMEIAMAYQHQIPVVAIRSTGGWSDRLANTFLDGRKKGKIDSARSAKEAVHKVMALIPTKRL